MGTVSLLFFIFFFRATFVQSYNTFWVDVRPTNMLLDSALNPTFTQGTCAPTTPAPVPFFDSPLFHLLTFFSLLVYIFLTFFFLFSPFSPALFLLLFTAVFSCSFFLPYFFNLICSSFMHVSFFFPFCSFLSSFFVVGCTDGQHSFGRHLGNGPIISCLFGLSDRDGGKGCRVWQNQGMLL